MEKGRNVQRAQKTKDKYRRNRTYIERQLLNMNTIFEYLQLAEMGHVLLLDSSRVTIQYSACDANDGEGGLCYPLLKYRSNIRDIIATVTHYSRNC